MQEDNKYLFNKRLKIPIYTAFFYMWNKLYAQKIHGFSFPFFTLL